MSCVRKYSCVHMYCSPHQASARGRHWADTDSMDFKLHLNTLITVTVLIEPIALSCRRERHFRLWRWDPCAWTFPMGWKIASWKSNWRTYKLDGYLTHRSSFVGRNCPSGQMTAWHLLTWVLFIFLFERFRSKKINSILAGTLPLQCPGNFYLCIWLCLLRVAHTHSIKFTALWPILITL